MANTWFFSSRQCQTMSERLTALKMEGSLGSLLIFKTKDNLASIGWEARIIFDLTSLLCKSAHLLCRPRRHATQTHGAQQQLPRLGDSCHRVNTLSSASATAIFFFETFSQRHRKKKWHNTFRAPATARIFCHFNVGDAACSFAMRLNTPPPLEM